MLYIIKLYIRLFDIRLQLLVAGNELISSDLIFSKSVDCINFRDSAIPILNVIKVSLQVETVDHCCSQPLTVCIQHITDDDLFANI